MRKIIGIIMCLLMVTASVNALAVSDDNSISVVVNGGYVQFDQQPVIQNGRTLVPMRAIFEALGATVDWDADMQMVQTYKYGTYVNVVIGESMLYKNDYDIPLDVPATIMNGRTLVPVRAVAEAFDCKVEWNAANRTVTIDSDTATEKSRKNQKRAIEISKAELNGASDEILSEYIPEGEKLLTSGGSTHDFEYVYRMIISGLSNFRSGKVNTDRGETDTAKSIMSAEAWEKLCGIIEWNEFAEVSFDSEDSIEKPLYEFILDVYGSSAFFNYDSYYESNGGEADPQNKFYSSGGYYYYTVYKGDAVDNILRTYFNVTDAQIALLHSGELYSGYINSGYYSDGYYYVSCMHDVGDEPVYIASAEIDEAYGSNCYRIKFTLAYDFSDYGEDIYGYDGTQYAYVKISDDGSFKLYALTREIEADSSCIYW